MQTRAQLSLPLINTYVDNLSKEHVDAQQKKDLIPKMFDALYDYLPSDGVWPVLDMSRYGIIQTELAKDLIQAEIKFQRMQEQLQTGFANKISQYRKLWTFDDYTTLRNQYCHRSQVLTLLNPQVLPHVDGLFLSAALVSHPELTLDVILTTMVDPALQPLLQERAKLTILTHYMTLESHPLTLTSLKDTMAIPEVMQRLTDAQGILEADLSVRVQSAVERYKSSCQNIMRFQSSAHRGAYGFFSWCRHGQAGVARADALLNDIQRHPNDAMTLLTTWLRDPQTRLHRHSLASFVLDALFDAASPPDRYDATLVTQALAMVAR